MMQAQPYPEMALADSTSSARNLGIGLASALSLSIAAALWFSNKPQLLRVAIPAMAALVGWLLYTSRPITYISYSLWVWFLAPFVRRIVDWHFGFFEPNFVLLAPLLVSGISLFTLLPSARRSSERIPVSFVLCGVAVFYGFVIGLLLHASPASVFGLLNWLCPMLFGLHLYLNWPQYGRFQAAITRTFVLALLILGLYAIFQFFAPPIWDRTWLENVKATSFGLPEPLQVRVWSTMNSPGPFANAMMAGLLLLLVVPARLKLPSAIAGYLSLLLSAVRTAWLSWIVGFILILKSVNPRILVRLVLSTLLLLVCLVPLASDPRISTVIGERFNTFTDLRHDESFGARLELYQMLIHDALTTPFGRGLEAARDLPIDSGILTLIFSLGWLGTALFTVGILSLFFWGGRFVNNTDDFYKAAKVIMIATFAQIISGEVFVNVTGAIFWMFAGMSLAAVRYHAAQPLVPAEQSLPGAIA